MNFTKLACVGLVAAAAASASQAGVVNGGFEAGLTGWLSSGLTCSGVGASYFAATGGCYGMDADPGPHSGNNALYLGTAAGNGVVSQAIATTSGQTYHVSFWLANGAYRQVSTPNDLLVEFGGQTLLHLTAAPPQPYAFYEFYVAANSGSSVLSFTNQQTPSFWVIDDVAASVPEPASLALAGIGLAALGLARRKSA